VRQDSVKRSFLRKEREKRLKRATRNRDLKKVCPIVTRANGPSPTRKERNGWRGGRSPYGKTGSIGKFKPTHRMKRVWGQEEDAYYKQKT